MMSLHEHNMLKKLWPNKSLYETLSILNHLIAETIGPHSERDISSIKNRLKKGGWTKESFMCEYSLTPVSRYASILGDLYELDG